MTFLSCAVDEKTEKALRGFFDLIGEVDLYYEDTLTTLAADEIRGDICRTLSKLSVSSIRTGINPSLAH